MRATLPGRDFPRGITNYGPSCASLAPLIKGDMSQYVQTLKDEWLAHVERLKAAGWRRAQQA